ncbi:MAG: 2Fe-2S iron-sulfur cluster-binding protein, partial [Chloroflexota bacterium]
MAEHTVTFDIAEGPVTVPTGTLLVEAARRAGVEISQPCGGQGRCGRCAVQVTAGTVRRRSALRLSAEDVAAGYALACQTVVEGDVRIAVPPQEKIERRLTTDRTAAEVQVPAGYDPARVQPIRRVTLTTTPPSLEDQTDDWSRIQKALRQHARLAETHISLMQLRRLGHILRRGDWQITVVLDAEAWDCPHCPVRLIELKRGLVSEDAPLWGVAIDIGTTTVSLWLVDLLTGRVHAQVAEYNAQIARGEDVISRIIYSGKGSGGEELRDLVLGTIKGLVEEVCRRVQIAPTEIMKATIAGNSTMIHLLLGIPARSIRLMPFVTA